MNKMNNPPIRKTMEFFLDTADVDEIRGIATWGILDGVTTNPSLIKKSGRDFKQVVAEIAEICDGPISAEVTALDTDGMISQLLLESRITRKCYH